MTRHSDFMMETRPYGGGHTNFVGIRCGWCKQEEWHPARNGGWAMRIFRSHGWKVGSKDAQHRCPTCFGKARNARRTPDNPAIPKEIGKALKKLLMEDHVRKELLSTTGLGFHPERPGTPDPQPPAEVLVIIRASDLPPPTEKATAPAPEPAVAPAKAVRGLSSTPGVTVHTVRPNARQAASRATGSVDGLGFFTIPSGDGWMWKLAADTTPEEQAAWRAGRRYGPKPTKRRADSKLGPKPKLPPTPLEIAQVASVAYATPKKEETTMTATVTPIPRKDPMPTPDTAEAAHAFQSTLRAEALDPNRQPTRDQRGLIHDELTKVYDPVDQRYGGSDSDKALGERLDLPWAWVRDIRAMFFGDFDRNAQTEKHKKELDAVIVLAGGAAKRLMEMAAEAETLEANLIAARKKLGD